ncbi:MAG TPA: hypothetical protein VGQ76_12595 [Thermoanaerobaculia bacterium]|jgi:hypothetical protein|nr:hypothetical protein [Thermoanaerobaculia bacterium]
MNRFTIVVFAFIALLAVAGSGFVGLRSETAQKNHEASIAALQARADAVERQAILLKRQLATLQPGSNVSVSDAIGATKQSLLSATSAGPKPDAAEQLKMPNAPITVNAMRDVLVTLDQCLLATRTLRCNFTITNQSIAEKKFILGIGGQARFEHDRGGSSVFDELGNDFMSEGGGVGNRSRSTCDAYDICEVEKILSPGVRTATWLRFDNVEPKAATVKLLRLKWSDGEAWAPMDFRNVSIEHQADR